MGCRVTWVYRGLLSGGLSRFELGFLLGIHDLVSVRKLITASVENSYSTAC